MKEKKGITLIALIITIIVMLILVGVTINIAMNGGLFSKAQNASDKTTIASEKEKLWMAAMEAIGENGEIDFAKLDANLPEGFSGSNGTYTVGKNSYAISNKGEITEKNKIGEVESGSIVGKYTWFTTAESIQQIEIYENNKAKTTLLSPGGNSEEIEFTYTYDSNTKRGIFALPISGTGSEITELEFEYVEIIENNSIINKILIIDGESNLTPAFTTNQGIGIIPLTGNIYANGNETIEFTKETINNVEFGIVTFKTNGEIADSGIGEYILVNGNLIINNYRDLPISEDFNTITINDSVLGNIVYTKQ